MEKFRARRKNLRFKMNEVFVMKGGNPLRGEVVISGAKNAALGIVAGALLTDEEVIIENLPDVRDINVMLEALKAIGAKVHRIESHVVSIQADQLLSGRFWENTIRRRWLYPEAVPSGKDPLTSILKALPPWELRWKSRRAIL